MIASIVAVVGLLAINGAVIYLAWLERKAMAIRFDVLLNRQIPGAAPPPPKPKGYKPPEPEVDESDLAGQIVPENNGSGY